MPTFTPPAAERLIRMEGALLLKAWHGLSVLRIAGEWVETELPTEQQVDAADLHFRGGCIYTIDDDTAAVLTAAGYEVSP
jgi:hypothetical protein